MKTGATHHGEDNSATPTLYLAFELGEQTWKLGFTTGAGQRPRVRTVARPAKYRRCWWRWSEPRSGLV